MKKTVAVALALMFLLGLSVSGALAYGFDDNTKVQEWNKGVVYGTWKDVIGDLNVYDTFGANLSSNTLTIFTNWNPYTMDQADPTVTTADLFIDVGCNGSWDYAIVLDVNRPDFGMAYENPTITTSDDLFKGQTSLIYGGMYDQAAPKVTPALGTSSDGDPVNVAWTVDTINQVAINLSGLDDLSQPFGFFWGTGTCSNDGFSACVPIPPSVLLMGSGLLGVGLLGWRRRSEDQVG